MKKLDKFESKLSSIMSARKEAFQRGYVTISSGTCGEAKGSSKVITGFKKELKKHGLEEDIPVKVTGCHGFCQVEPIVIIGPEKHIYINVTPDDVGEIVTETILEKRLVERLMFLDTSSGKRCVHVDEIPFYKKQKRNLSGMNEYIDPHEIDDYIAQGGYSSLVNVLKSQTPEQVIETIKSSGIRGRGGAGFPTGLKWEICRKSKCNDKYIVCNADEGDPGAYMDRSLLEGNPHSVLEGMLIGAFAIGANKGILYIRHEYPMALKNVKIALEQMRKYGLLGNDILGTGLDFEVGIVPGAGAFVCGEETALIASIEGKKGEPRQRPPFPAERGVWGKPTNINNVETWANIPLIINKGAKWYANIGTGESKGTKIFSLVGKINNTGLVEVPMGITLREMVYDVGGGIPNGKGFKAIQTGGPSGGCIPEQLLDLPVDYQKLAEAGSIMGSGGMVVMDEDTCMVDVAKYFLTFLQDESCGKCLTCREGIERMLEIVTEITEGKGSRESITLLEELGTVVKDASMCALGQTAPNPVLSTLRYFKDEYEAHISENKCPACVCTALFGFNVIEDECTGCGACKKACPEKAIVGEKKKAHRILQEKCIKCGLCLDTCAFNAIKKIPGGA